MVDARLATLVLAAGSGGLYLAQSAYWKLSANIGRQSAGSVAGVMKMGCQAGDALVGIVTPIIAAQAGWSSSFLFTAAISFICAIAWLFIDPDAALTIDDSRPSDTFV